MSTSAFLTFAERHDLDFFEQVKADAGSMPAGSPGPIAGGRLPGDLLGVVGALRQEIPGEDGSAAVRDCVFVLTRIPESTAFLPYVTCRDTVVRGIVDRLVGPGGLVPLVDHVEFESIELNRRYRIGALRGTSGNRLRQLFAPTLIDWMASTAPEGLYFELFGGVLFLTVTGKVEEESDIEHACSLAAHLAGRIRDESLESLDEKSRVPVAITPQQAENEKRRAETLAASGFSSPSRDLKAALERIEPEVKRRSKGFLRKVFKSIGEFEALDLALEAVMRGYGESRGLEWQRPTDFLARHAGAPLPLTATQALRGQLPGLGVPGDLFVRGDRHQDRFVLGATVPWPGGEGSMIIVPASERPAETETTAGFWFVAKEGARRTGSASARDAEVSALLGQELEGKYAVIASGCKPADLASELRSWLLAESRSGAAVAVVFGGVLAIMDSAVPSGDFSVDALDAMCRSLKPFGAEI